MNDEQIASLYTVFKTLPDEVTTWLTSEQVSAALATLGKQYVLSDEQSLELPFLLLRLVTENIPPEQFVGELSRSTSLPTDTVQRITDEIKTTILTPIEKPLRFLGIDIALLKFGATAPAATPPSPIKPIQKTSSSTTQPFILHEEPSFTPTPQPVLGFTPPPQEVGRFTPPPPTTPPKVIIERVVHYSLLYTPFTQASLQKNRPEKQVGVPKSKWFV